jgi:hypothetical protein
LRRYNQVESIEAVKGIDTCANVKVEHKARPCNLKA